MTVLNHTGFLLGLYLVNKTCWDWELMRAVSLRNLSSMVAKMTCMRWNLWHIPVSGSGARGFQQSSFQHAWTTGKEAILLTQSIIMQIWHQGISIGHQNLNDPSPLLRLRYTTWSLPLSVQTTSQWIFLPLKEERSIFTKDKTGPSPISLTQKLPLLSFWVLRKCSF